MRRTKDAVIIGGGIHGCSIAYHLAKKGWKNILLLEKDYLAAGGTGRSAAGIRHQFGTEINIRLAAASVRRMENLEEELGYPQGIELLQKGYLMLAYTETQLEQFRENISLQKSIDPHNLTVIMTPEERREMARVICERMAAAQGPVVLLLPSEGGNEWDRPGGPLSDAEGLAAFVEAMRAHCPANARLVEMDAHINDPAFAQAALAVVDEWREKGVVVG